MATMSPHSTCAKKKKFFVLGGDGFCGWPTALHLSDKGHDVTIIDNLARRKIDVDLHCSSLTPITSIETRLEVWNSISGKKKVRFVHLDLALEYDRFLQLLNDEAPGTLVHFAEQRAAPYSMKSGATKRYTVDNNQRTTHNVLCAMVESKLPIHLVHLGTMGVYGYGKSGGKIPEGYMDVAMPNGEKRQILHPAYPGSIYHMTKCLDALMFQYYVKNDQLRITDLHQGIVWGTDTPNTSRDPRLVNRFDYDSDYGTVMNRFLMQAACGIPLTVYGTGEQTRAFIHITDTCRCIELAAANPPAKGQPVEILNQVAQTASIMQIATIVARMSNVEVQTQTICNPRMEDVSNELDVTNEKFKTLGLNPILLDSAEGLLTEVQQIAGQYAERCDRKKVLPTSFWNVARAAATNAEGEPEPVSKKRRAQ